MLHVYIVESELPDSKTSVAVTWEKQKELLKSSSHLGSSEFKSCQSLEEVNHELSQFASWTETLPPKDPVILWLSVHGLSPRKSGTVGTSGASALGEKVEWYKSLEPIKQCSNPSRTIILLDVCWGGSPTIASRLTTPKRSRPYMVFGPSRSAFRKELDIASELIIESVAASGLPTRETATDIVLKLNDKYAASHLGSFYRVWWWDGKSIHAYPALT
jgi:hypothetical protein